VGFDLVLSLTLRRVRLDYSGEMVNIRYLSEMVHLGSRVFSLALHSFISTELATGLSISWLLD